MAKKKVLLIQPHSDDILFSASKFLFNQHKYSEIKVLTLECGNEKRVNEDIALFDFFDVKHENLGFEIEDDSYYHYYKEHKVFLGENCYDILAERYGTKLLKEIKDKLVNYVKKHKRLGYEIIVPLGVGHPMHFYVKDCLEKYSDLFYRDFPHSYKRKTKLDFENSLTEFILESEHFDEEEHQMKFDVSYQIYKTQRSLLFFEKGYIDKKIAEQFYKRK